MTPVDVFASEPHFLDHLRPIWAALPAWARGEVLVSLELEELLLERGADVSDLRALDPKALDVSRRTVIVAAIGDYRKVVDRRPTILAEHGAGQTYNGRNPSYAGGIGRDRARLFLVPNGSAARKNRARYPFIPTAVVGSPKIDSLLRIAPPRGVATAAVSFHWRCKVAPETGSAFDHFAPILAQARLELLEANVRLVAHAHPRLLEEARPVYEEAGLEVLDSFEEVVERAHVYAVDNSSTLYEFAALDRPVVVLNAPAYRRNVSHGLRFWDAADVGEQVDRPEDFVEAVLRAFEDPPERVRSREKALERVYPVRDGTSSLRAAKAVLDVTSPGLCFVCGAAHASCSPSDRPSSSAPSPGDPKMTLRLYPNPSGHGFVRLTDEDARRRGFVVESPVDTPPEVPQTAHDAPGAPPETSDGGEDLPEGAIAPGGPTARARAAKKAAAKKPVPADGEAEQKKRPAPTGTRRRRPAQTSDETST